MRLLQTRRRRPRTALSTGLLVLTALAAWALPAAPPAAAQVQRVESWGYNGFGQLGDGTTDNRHTPVTVAGLTAANTTGLAASTHGLAVLSNGTVKAWGANDYGQLGDGTTSDLSDPDHLTPGTVPELSGVTAVATGCLHSLALLSNGTVKAWGNNFSGQLGDGTTGSISTTPVTVIDPSNPSVPLSGVTAIAAGCDHSLALLSNGTVKAWGDNSAGQLGNGSTGGTSGTPVTVVNLTGVRDIDAGDSHSLALLSNQTVRAWGDNSDGQLGNGSTGGTSGTPVTVVNLIRVRGISAGRSHSLARLSDDTLRAWGGNDQGQLGNASTTGSDTPITVRTGIGTISLIVAGSFHSMAA
ncbi:RCC1 domain-containing protein [Streptomyces sp. NPDC059875]|uniref:RCC1 domain-containing protein n=1 Tax=unclassified Streptomyces TaxID=2593676 RepID=UPI00364BFF82